MVARRTILAATAAALGVVTAGTAAATSVAERSTRPRTRVARRTLRDGRLRVEQTAFALSHLAVTSDGPVAQVRVKTRKGWSGWQTVDGCAGGRDGVDDLHSGLLVTTEATGYEVRVAGAGTGEVTELDTGFSASTLAAAAVAASMPLANGTTCSVPYLSRAAWGGDESQRTWGEDGYYPVQTITVHHSGFGNDDPDPAATIRGIYYNQAVTKGWGDIGYHLLIDEAGRVYEGRWSGSDTAPATRATLAADGRPLLSTGAHVGGFNSGNLGICLLGDFTLRQPTAAARRSLETVLTSLTRLCRLDPLGTTTYVNQESGVTKTMKVIPGHRDWAATECPGNDFYPEVADVRRNVAKALRLVQRRTSTSTGTTRPLPPRR
ncbi:MAG TPA: peptidoglycan recognition family protein [Micromonosporaceae bacterium]|nr:peptidoglycan recognition family protein [Micromonosporaceae bacterium]